MLRVCAAGLLLVASLAHAESVQTWDFRGQMPGRWDMSGLRTEQTQYGLLAQGEKGGFLLRTVALDNGSDVVEVWAAAAARTDAALIWHLAGTPEDVYAQMPFVIPQGSSPQRIDLTPNQYPEWKAARIDEIGIGFAGEADILLMQMAFHARSLPERALEAWKSLWTFDKFRLYSVNFLWGPLMTFDPVNRARLYQSLPPYGRSVLQLFYPLLALSLLPLAWAFFGKHGRRERLRAGGIAVCAFAACWILFDARMTAEFASYVAADWRMHILPPAGEKTFRTVENFVDMVEQSKPELEKAGTFAALLPQDYPFLSLLRYHAAPNTFLRESESQSGASLFFVFARPDAGVDELGLLHGKDGKVISRPGNILREFGDGSFLFRTDAP